MFVILEQHAVNNIHIIVILIKQRETEKNISVRQKIHKVQRSHENQIIFNEFRV